MTIVKRLYFLTFISLLVSVLNPAISQSLRLGLSKSEQPVKEEVRITYSNVPALTGKQFYTLFIFSSGGGSYHDSKPLQSLPSGTVTLSPIQKAGSFDIVLYKYEDFSDAKPKQVARVPFKAVIPKSPGDKAPTTTLAKATKPAEVPKQDSKTPVRNGSVSETTVTKATNKTAVVPVSSTIKEPAKSNAVMTVNSKSAFHIRPQSTFNVEEEILLQYDLPLLGETQYYTIAVCRPEDTYILNVSRELKQVSGSLTLKPIYQAGVYEFRVFRGDKTTLKEELLYRQPITIGNVSKSFPGRYECSGAAPKTFGTPAKGSPTLDVIMPLLTKEISQQKLEIWLKPDDICVEYFSVQFLSPSSVKVNGKGRTATHSSFPVKVRYKYAVNDFVNKKATIAEEGTDKVYHFYKSGAKNWSFVEIKSVESLGALRK